MKITVPIKLDHDDLQRIVDEKIEELKTQFVLRKNVDEAIAEISRKSHSGQWSDAASFGMDFAVSIIRRHLDTKEPEDAKD